jgi:hypothetical protein
MKNPIPDIPDINIEIKPPRYANLILAAREQVEVDVVFQCIFEELQRGKEQYARQLLQWLALSSVTMQVHIELLISSLRLTSTHRELYEADWKMLLETVQYEIVSREQEDPAALLAGLKP